jgi:hypothetical protein
MIALLLATLALMPQQRAPHFHGKLPAGTHWGRCLLVVEGKTRINGRCSYSISKGGDFHIDGPRQVFNGIDYPRTDLMPLQYSTDYWADVFRDGAAWDGFGNSDIRATHGDSPWGPLRREGACYIGRTVRICLWAR